MLTQELVNFIAVKAYNMRVDAIRMTTQAKSGHPTSVLSCADLVAALFFYAMRFDPQNHKNPNNDRFILSKGHAAPVLYGVYKQLGIITDQELMSYRSFDSALEGHPTPRFDRVDVATGSLGQGLGMGLGMSLAGMLDERNFRTWVLMGDSETSEGSVWEAAELAYYYRTDHLIAIVDVNRLGQTGPTVEGYNIERDVQKFSSFGWHVIAIDGHDLFEICAAYDEAKKMSGKPIVILAKTVKGYGVEFVEDKNGFHGKPFSAEQEPEALRDLAMRFKAEASYDNSYVWRPNLPPADEIPCTQNSSIDEALYSAKLKTYLSEQAHKSAGKELVIATRKAYGEALAALGDTHKQIVSLDAEVKNSTYAQTFEQKHPERFFQCFIAEQNMVSMGVGLAARDKLPFCSTFASFLSRAVDQIRMAAISRSNIKLVASHAGVSIGKDGPSQMGLEDIAYMRAIPNSVVLHPCDAVSTWKLVAEMARYEHIAYLRTLRPDTPIIYSVDHKFSIGGCHLLRSYEVAHVCVITAGYPVFEALKAHDILREQNIVVNVIDLYSIKPIDTKSVIEAARRSNRCVITVEDHYLQGGLGEAVTYELRNETMKITCLAVHKMPRSGTPRELYAYEGIDAQSIVATIHNMVGASS